MLTVTIGAGILCGSAERFTEGCSVCMFKRGRENERQVLHCCGSVSSVLYVSLSSVTS